MPDVLIRGLSEAAVAHLDSQAMSLGISRNELVRRRLEAEVPAGRRSAAMSSSDWEVFAISFADLADPDVMASAWR